MERPINTVPDVITMFHIMLDHMEGKPMIVKYWNGYVHEASLEDLQNWLSYYCSFEGPL